MVAWHDIRAGLRKQSTRGVSAGLTSMRWVLMSERIESRGCELLEESADIAERAETCRADTSAPEVAAFERAEGTVWPESSANDVRADGNGASPLRAEAA